MSRARKSYGISKETAAVTRKRLRDSATRKVPWISTMTPAELSLSRSHGIRPVAMVTGACRMRGRYLWTVDHDKGWRTVVTRLRAEAKIVGANAVVDVKLHRQPVPDFALGRRFRSCQDFSATGTAVRVDGLPPSKAPLIADVPALEFARLLQIGIVPSGIAIGAHFKSLNGGYRRLDGSGITWNKPLLQLGGFWAEVQRKGWAALAKGSDGAGTHILAHTHYRSLLKREGRGRNEPNYLGRQIAIGTMVDCGESSLPVPAVRLVVDMRDDDSPLLPTAKHTRNTYPVSEEQELV